MMTSTVLQKQTLEHSQLEKTGLRLLSDANLIESLRKLVTSERKTTAEIIEHIKEVDSRRLYLGLGYPSLFAYLTEGLGYTSASAQRRIDAARMLRSNPEIAADLKSGLLNLMQVSLLAQSLRQKSKSEGVESIELSHKQQSEILDQIKCQSIAKSQEIISKVLQIAPVKLEKRTNQSDESVRMELTFTKEQMLSLQKVKDLVSHSLHNPTWAELINMLALDFIKRKDPARKISKTHRDKAIGSNKERDKINSSNMEATPTQITSTVEVEESAQKLTPGGVKHLEKSKIHLEKVKPSTKTRQHIPCHVRRGIHQRDHHCQYVSSTGIRCRSTYQLQLDHIQPIWAGGKNSIDNLRVLCAAHNRQQYREQAALRYRD